MFLLVIRLTIYNDSNFQFLRDHKDDISRKRMSTYVDERPVMPKEDAD